MAPPCRKVSISAEDQAKRISEALNACYHRIVNYTPHINGSYCAPTWDTLACWPETPAGQVATQPCPTYAHQFNFQEFATKECMDDGQWFVHPDMNASWTNYTACFGHDDDDDENSDTVSEIIQWHLPHLRMLGNVGYGVSLVALLAAMALMLNFKKLHCPRNTLHMNLFVSFILRSVISFTRENLMVEGLGLNQDLYVHPVCGLAFNNNGSHWECKTLHAAYMYIISANCLWIFVEGLYLHMLIFMAVFSENSNVTRYVIIGWVTPLLFIVPWVGVRLAHDDYLCWQVSVNKGYFWIIRGPITLSIVVNFIFFINIVRVIFTKMKSPGATEARLNRYRKLAKSTLVLIPLFGIHYIVFIWIDPSFASDTLELVWLYFENFLNSFQGSFIAVLFCFLNGEVQAEVKKSWQRYQLRRGGASFSLRSRDKSFNNTSSTYMCRDAQLINDELKCPGNDVFGDVEHHVTQHRDCNVSGDKSVDNRVVHFAGHVGNITYERSDV